MIDLGKAKLVLNTETTSLSVSLFGEGDAYRSVCIKLRDIFNSSLVLSDVKVVGLNVEIGEHKPPTPEVCHYDYIEINTPLEMFRIEWKGWKDDPVYLCFGLTSGFCHAIDARTHLEAIALSVAAYADRLKECFVVEENGNG